MFTRSRYPVEISSLEVTIGIDTHQPAIGSWLVAGFLIKIGERRKAKFNAAIVVVPGFPVMRITAPTALAVVTVIDGVCVLGGRLTVPKIRCASCVAVKTATGLSGAVTKLVSPNPGRAAAITAAQIAAAVSLDKARLADDAQPTETFAWLMMMTLCLCCFVL